MHMDHTQQEMMHLGDLVSAIVYGPFTIDKSPGVAGNGEHDMDFRHFQNTLYTLIYITLFLIPIIHKCMC